MGITQPVMFMPESGNRFGCFGFRTASGEENGLDPFQRFTGQRIGSLCVQGLHQGRDERSISLGSVKEHSFQIGGNQNVHRGRTRLQEGAAAIVDTGRDKVRQDIVGVGSTDQAANRKAHLTSKITRQYITEVAGRNNKINQIAKTDSFRVH